MIDDEDPQVHELMHPFMNQKTDFVLGFEVGSFYRDCEAHDVVEGVFRQRNEGELLRLADFLGLRRSKWEPADDYWVFGRFERPQPASPHAD